MNSWKSGGGFLAGIYKMRRFGTGHSGGCQSNFVSKPQRKLGKERWATVLACFFKAGTCSQLHKQML